MPKSLSDAAVRNAKAKTKTFKMSDGKGLFLVVMPSGSKYWRLRYFFVGKEKLLALGVYPEISLADARERRTQARKVIAAGIDPGKVKKEAKRLAVLNGDNTFEAVAREWHENRRSKWDAKTRPAHFEAHGDQCIPQAWLPPDRPHHIFGITVRATRS